VSREVREELRNLETELGLTTNEAVGRAVHSLLDELKWKKIGEYYKLHPEVAPEDQAWMDSVAREQSLDQG
jgi:hypothetical protein